MTYPGGPMPQSDTIRSCKVPWDSIESYINLPKTGWQKHTRVPSVAGYDRILSFESGRIRLTGTNESQEQDTDRILLL